jgi:hypothetical protein
LLLVGPLQAKRDLVDLTRVGKFQAKGRVQDDRQPVIDTLIKAGPSATSFLVSKLEDRSRVRRQVLDFWPAMDVGQVALMVLCDLFTLPDLKTPTIAGLTWDEVLENANQDLPAWTVYENFIARYGREGLRAKVERLLAPHEGKLSWDTSARCFRPQP